jgi:hypothetical protein
MLVQTPLHRACPGPQTAGQTPFEHVPPPGQDIWVPEQPPPLSHVSPVVQALPSLQDAPVVSRSHAWVSV